MQIIFSLFVSLAVSFQTPQPINIGIIGDTQYKYSKKNRRVFDKAIFEMNREKIRFMIHLGDQHDGGGKRKYKIFRKRIRKLNAPYYLLIGNHELNCAYPSYMLCKHYKKKWMQYWNYKSTYYYFDRYGYRFIILDTSWAWLDKEQINWFRNVLNNTPKNMKILLFTHRPIAIPYASTIYYKKGKHTYAKMGPIPYFTTPNKNLWKLFYKNRKRISMMFHGHYHAYRHYRLFGVETYCSGGGGRGEFKHFLMLRLYNNQIHVDVKPL